MILSDRDIKQYLQEGKIKIEPLDIDKQIQPSGVDLRLGNSFKVFRNMSIPFIDTKAPVEGYTETIEIEDDKPFIIHPGEFVLAATKEYIKLPNDLAAMVDGRSSLGRLGISIHTTSSGINPGWEGFFTLEIINLGKIPVALYPNMRICKISFVKLTSEAEKPYQSNKYQYTSTPEESKIFKEFK
jgi:dCTP deaminase